MRKPFLFVAVAAMVAGSVAADPASAQVKSSESIKATIEKANMVFANSMNAGKYGDVAVLYTDDAVVMPAGAPAVTGAAAIREYWQGMAAFKPSDLTLKTGLLDVHGDVAIETGSYTMKVTPPGSNAAMEDKGKYLVVWKLQKDGSWKIYRDMFSSDISPQ